MESMTVISVPCIEILGSVCVMLEMPFCDVYVI